MENGWKDIWLRNLSDFYDILGGYD